MFMLDNGYPNENAVKLSLDNTWKHLDIVSLTCK